jgi:transcription initiation factor TFIID subunit TAF12
MSQIILPFDDLESLIEAVVRLQEQVRRLEEHSNYLESRIQDLENESNWRSYNE